MTRQARGAALLLLLGCGAQMLPPPSIESIAPTTMDAARPTAVAVQVDVQLPVEVNFGQGTLDVDSEMHVRVGNQDLGSGAYPPGGLVQGTVPTVLAPGTYDVTVVLGDGRSAVRRSAFTVTPAPAGSWPSAYTVDPIGAQRSGIPFPVTVRAVGPASPGFNGNVLFSVTGASGVVPSISAAFSSGVLVQTVTVTGPGSVVLLVDDIDNNHGQSAPFTVGP